MKKRKESKILHEIPKTYDEIRDYYFRTANVNNLEELKTTIYWEYYLGDVKNIYKKKASSSKILVGANNIDPVVFACNKCNRPLGAAFSNQLIINLRQECHNSNNLEITCNCGEKNIFNNHRKMNLKILDHETAEKEVE